MLPHNQIFLLFFPHHFQTVPPKILPVCQHFWGKRLKIMEKKQQNNVAYMGTFLKETLENVAEKKQQKNVVYVATFLE